MHPEKNHRHSCLKLSCTHLQIFIIPFFQPASSLPSVSEAGGVRSGLSLMFKMWKDDDTNGKLSGQGSWAFLHISAGHLTSASHPHPTLWNFHNVSLKMRRFYFRSSSSKKTLSLCYYSRRVWRCVMWQDPAMLGHLLSLPHCDNPYPSTSKSLRGSCRCRSCF